MLPRIFEGFRATIQIVIASRIPPRPLKAEACHSGAAGVGKPVMYSEAFNASCDEDCKSSAGWRRCPPGPAYGLDRGCAQDD